MPALTVPLIEAYPITYRAVAAWLLARDRLADQEVTIAADDRCLWVTLSWGGHLIVVAFGRFRERTRVEPLARDVWHMLGKAGELLVLVVAVKATEP